MGQKLERNYTGEIFFHHLIETDVVNNVQNLDILHTKNKEQRKHIQMIPPDDNILSPQGKVKILTRVREKNR